MKSPNSIKPQVKGRHLPFIPILLVNALEIHRFTETIRVRKIHSNPTNMADPFARYDQSTGIDIPMVDARPRFPHEAWMPSWPLRPCNKNPAATAKPILPLLNITRITLA